MTPPCWTCQERPCSYRLFIDCPKWCEWAAEANQEEEESEK